MIIIKIVTDGMQRKSDHHCDNQYITDNQYLVIAIMRQMMVSKKTELISMIIMITTTVNTVD